MKIKGYKRTRCEKRLLSKCADGVARTFSVLESKFADYLQEDESVASFRCNVLLDDFPEGEYCSDFVCIKTNGDLMVRECVYRKHITKPKTIRLLDASRNYWIRRGVTDWGLVIDKKKEDSDESKGSD